MRTFLSVRTCLLNENGIHEKGVRAKTSTRSISLSFPFKYKYSMESKVFRWIYICFSNRKINPLTSAHHNGDGKKAKKKNQISFDNIVVTTAYPSKPNNAFSIHRRAQTHTTTNSSKGKIWFENSFCHILNRSSGRTKCALQMRRIQISL